MSWKRWIGKHEIQWKDRLYLIRKRGGRGLIGCKKCIDAELNNLIDGTSRIVLSQCCRK